MFGERWLDHKIWEQVIIFDLSRHAARHIQYATLESLKDGLATAPIPECKEKIFEPLKVIVIHGGMGLGRRKTYLDILYGS